MYVRKMFQIPSLIQSNGRESNATDTEKIHNNYYLYQKNPYRVLFVMPKWSVLCFYLRSISVGMFVLFKWTFQMLWNVVSPASISSRFNTNSIEYYGCLHDKPPPCLVNNRIGLQSYVKLKGVKLHYIEAGCHGDPFILLLHGFPDCWLGWHYQIKELSRFFRVVALDLKGFNDSDKPQWRKDYTPQIICGELLQFIKSMGVNNVTIIGHDIGALIGWFFAHTHPEHVERFISVSASHPNLMWDNLHTKSVMNDSWLKFVQIPYLPEMELTRIDSQFIEKTLTHVQNDVKNSPIYDIHDTPFEQIANKLDAYKYVFSRKSDWTGPLNYYRNFPFYRIKTGETIRCPCLIIIGSEDNFCRLDSVVKSTEYCENYVVKIIENAGHWPHQEVPGEFNRVILKFLVGHRANKSTMPIDKTNRSIMGRMFGAVSNSVKIGTYMLDSVQQRTNDVIHNALH